jgi:5-methylcytosine-specific restriction enzyme A
MSRTLLRRCLDCPRSVRGKSRCVDCERAHQRAKRSKRSDLDDARERERRRRLVADHRARVGDWCSGLGNHPAHPSADLVADHVIEVAAGGPASGPLRVLCRSENSRRSAWLATGLCASAAATTPRPPHFPTLLETTTEEEAPAGPSVA